MDKVDEQEIEAKRQAILRQHQYVDPNTPEEEKIMTLLQEELVSTDWAKNTFSDIQKMLVQYFHDSLSGIQDSHYVHDRTQQLLKDIAVRTNAKIISGQENLDGLTKGSPVFLCTNHLGIYKLATIDPKKELGLEDVGVDRMYSLPLFHASNMPVAESLKDNLYIAAFEFPGKVGEIQKMAGGVVIRLEEEKNLLHDSVRGTDRLITKTRKFMDEHPNGALSILPEGRTSGKRAGKSSYDLDDFKTGAFVVAAAVEIPILPVPQYFNPNSGFEVGILEPIHLTKDVTWEQSADIARATQSKMQEWLNQRKIDLKLTELPRQA